MAFYRLIFHDGLGRMSKHLCHIQVKRFLSISLYEREVSVASGLTYHIQRCTLTFGNRLHVVKMLLVNEQSHALLTLVGNDFLGTERLITNRQLGHVNLSTAVFYQFRQAVQVSSTSMVMDGHHWVAVFFHQSPYQVVSTLLHFGVSTLYSVQFYTTGIASCINR